jgi:folate-binding protein YgfZ
MDVCSSKPEFPAPMLEGNQMSFAELPDRGVVRVAGNDARDFLQGLITNDVTHVRPDHAVWAALLTPQGKYLHDFFIIEIAGALMLDCEAARADDLTTRLTRYKLRAAIEIENVSTEWAVATLMGSEADSGALQGFEGRAGPFGGGVCYVDPRFGGIGARALLPRTALGALSEAGFTALEPAAYHHARVCAGLPDGSRDLTVDKALLLENGFDALNGIDWDKGCFVGQELTARMRYRATARRQLLPVAIEGPAPEPGSVITLNEKEAGEMRSMADGIGLALLRVDALATLHEGGGALTAGAATLSPLRPPWMAQAGSGKEDPE